MIAQIENLISCVLTFLYTIFLHQGSSFSVLYTKYRKRVKPGGLLIGIIPDSEKIIFKTPYTDASGNFFKLRGPWEWWFW